MSAIRHCSTRPPLRASVWISKTRRTNEAGLMDGLLSRLSLSTATTRSNTSTFHHRYRQNCTTIRRCRTINKRPHISVLICGQPTPVLQRTRKPAVSAPVVGIDCMAAMTTNRKEGLDAEGLASLLRDCRRILRNPVAVVVTLGVAILPSRCTHGSAFSPTGILFQPPAITVAPANED